MFQTSFGGQLLADDIPLLRTFVAAACSIGQAAQAV
jgi:hypothetical protein